MRTPNVSDLTVMTGVLFAVTTIITLARLAVRKFQRRHLQADDYCNVFALVLIIIITGMVLECLPVIKKLELGTLTAADNKKITVFNLVGNFLARAILLACQATFLALYWNLFNISAVFRKAWFGVAVYVTLCFFVNFLLIFWSCGSPRDILHPDSCQRTSSPKSSRTQLIVVNVLSVTSDLAIVCLPLGMLHNLHVKLVQKLCLAAVFAVGSLVIIFDILRTVFALQQSTGSNTGLLMVWTISEPYIAVIVAAMPPLYTLINPNSGNSRVRRYTNIDRSSRIEAHGQYGSRPWESHDPEDGDRSSVLKRQELELRELQKYAPR